MNHSLSQRSPKLTRYGLPYIPNKAVFAAAMFARQMVREDTPPGVANTRAADYYGVPVSEVAHYTGMVAARCAQRRKYNRR